MSALRHSPLLRAAVLGAYLLVVIASLVSASLRTVDSPWMCSSAGMPNAPVDGVRSLDCPACLPLQAPPSPLWVLITPTPESTGWWIGTDHPIRHGQPALLPPARGPPFV